jgi:hypothetical protein
MSDDSVVMLVSWLFVAVIWLCLYVGGTQYTGTGDPRFGGAPPQRELDLRYKGSI